MEAFDSVVDFVYRTFGYAKVTGTSILVEKQGGHPVAGARVTLFQKVDGATAWSRDGTGLTGTSGQARSSFYAKKGRTYKVQAQFPGIQGRYDSASSAVQTISV